MSRFSNINWQNFKRIFVTDDTPSPRANIPKTKVIENNLSPKPRKRSFRYRINRQWQPRVKLEMKRWRGAVEIAEDPMRPRREELYGLYHSASEDEHYLAQLRTAQKTVLLSDFNLHKNGKPANELKELFEKPWFRQFVKIAVDTEFWGHSLIEFSPRRNDQGEFENLVLIPREHVRPESGEVVLNIHDEKGIPFRKPSISKHLIELGESDDLGLLKIISKVAIKKDYSLNDWDRKNEKYGTPFLVVKTRTTDKKELDERAEMAANFGSNSWGIFDDMDEIELLESKHVANGHLSFLDRAKYADEKISQLVNGQTGTSEQKAYVGSAEVHERILNDYTLERLDKIQSWINFCLVPFLITNGYPQLEGAKFHYTDLLERQQQKEETSMEKQKEKQSPPKKDDEPKSAPEKKKLSLARNDLHLYYNNADGCCNPNLPKLEKLAFNLKAIMEASIRAVFNKKLKAGDVDAEGWKYDVEQLWNATQLGAGGLIIETDYSKTTTELLNQFKKNIHVFAAFKNHARVADMTAALLDANGQPREWEEFRQAAQLINAQYFENWLRAEYNQAQGAAQMAVKWQDYQANADILPFIQYVTQGDDRVRAAHAAIDGVTLPMDDPFWDEYYPPNGWNCRCTVNQVAGPKVPAEIFPNEEQVHPSFKNNPAKSKEIFTEDHPYFNGIPKKQRQNLLKAVNKLVKENEANAS